MSTFDINCRACPRLAHFMDEVKRKHPAYHCRPVPPFGDQNAHLMVVGMAPGMHGANASGRPFTGDHAGILLYQTLFEFGFSNQPQATEPNDGLKLINCRITNAVKCLPPQNKPVAAEVNQCQSYLQAELHQLPANSVILTLGGIAHNAVLKTLGLKKSDYPFGHNICYDLANQPQKPLSVVSSYHCSRYNTQTRRLTPDMFRAVFETIQNKLTHA